VFRFYVKVEKVQTGEDERRMSSLWDSRLPECAEGRRSFGSPRTVMAEFLNKFEGRVISIYEVYVNDNGLKQLIAWLEVP
jgi:hypothetical protein